ncbi:MAG: hypothetical protein NTY53_05140 [Kiritimatiellaeota bacterium]|nr:hypothetical protein [Kiritimatiellota bacterium]
MKTETIISLSIAISGVALCTYLLVGQFIGQAAFVTLISVLSLVCLVIPVLRRLKQLDLKNLKMTLEKIEKVKAEVFAKEESLTKVSLLASQLIAFNSAFEGRLHDDDSFRLQNEWFYRKINDLLAAVHATPATTAEVLKYFHAIRRQDQSSGDAKKLVWKDLMNMIREDIGESSKP